MAHREQHPLTGEIVIVAPERADRPNAFQRESAGVCPFCPGHEEETPPEIARIESEGAWALRVVPNRYPAVTTDSALRGRHEVIVDTAHHSDSPYTWSHETLTRVLEGYQSRIDAALNETDARYVIAFKNSGANAGETLTHPHSQLIALSEAPQRQPSTLCGVCEALREAAVIVEDADVVAFAPRGARLPFETMIAPRDHGGDFRSADAPKVARVVQPLMRAIAAAFGAPSFNWYIETTPSTAHWSMSVLPRLTNIAGFELASGMWINVITADESARRLRASLKEAGEK